MAASSKSSKRSRSRSSSSRSRRNGHSGRSASQKTEKYRFAQNTGGERTMAEREYETYALTDPAETGGDPDVLLDVPVVKVDSIHLQLEELDAHVSLKAQVLDLVKLNVGVDVHLGKVRVDVKGVEAQALLKVRLDHVASVVDRVLTTIDRNPELVRGLGRAVSDIGSGAGEALGETGEAVGEVGEGAGQAVEQIGEGAGQGVGELGQGVGQAAGNLDQVVGQAGQAVGQLGQGAGQAVGGAGEAAGQLGETAGQLAGSVGQAGGGRQATNGGGAGGGPDVPGGGPGASGGQLAKEAAKTVAAELGSAASDEARDLGIAATRKVKELGERRRQRRAEKLHATPAAIEAASELGVDLAEVEGSGSEGRITVKDVREASTS